MKLKVVGEWRTNDTTRYEENENQSNLYWRAALSIVDTLEPMRNVSLLRRSSSRELQYSSQFSVRRKENVNVQFNSSSIHSDSIESNDRFSPNLFSTIECIGSTVFDQFHSSKLSQYERDDGWNGEESQSDGPFQSDTEGSENSSVDSRIDDHSQSQRLHRYEKSDETAESVISSVKSLRTLFLRFAGLAMLADSEIRTKLFELMKLLSAAGIFNAKDGANLSSSLSNVMGLLMPSTDKTTKSKSLSSQKYDFTYDATTKETDLNDKNKNSETGWSEKLKKLFK